MGRIGSWRLFRDDDHGSDRIRSSPGQSRGESVTTITASQKALKRLTEKKQKKQKRDKEELEKTKFCSNCGGEFTINDFPGKVLSEWKRIFCCAKCPPEMRSHTRKHCTKCRGEIRRQPNQTLGSWGKVSVCDNCKAK